MKSILGKSLKKIIFAFGLLYGIDIMLNKVGIYLPINVVTVAITAFLGTPGLLSLFTILHLLN